MVSPLVCKQFRKALSFAWYLHNAVTFLDQFLKIFPSDFIWAFWNSLFYMKRSWNKIRKNRKSSESEVYCPKHRQKQVQVEKKPIQLLKNKKKSGKCIEFHEHLSSLSPFLCDFFSPPRQENNSPLATMLIF